MPALGPSIGGAVRGLVEEFVYGHSQPVSVPRPPCRVQRPLGQIVGQNRLYPRLESLPAGR